MAINYHNHNINTSGTITSPSGNFTTLIVNGTSVSNFNSSVSGLLPTIANSGDNRVLTSTGSSVGINAEANLTFNGSLLDVVGGGSFSSQTVFASGTAAAPGISILGDTDTGISQLATNTLSIMTSGTERLTVNSGGNIGIGTSSPSTKLEIFGTEGGGATIRINDGTQDLRLYTSAGIGVVGTISNSSLGFHTNNTERMRITSDGNVGIGSSTNNANIRARLQIAASDADDDPSLGSGTGALLVTNSDSAYGIQFGVSADGVGWIQQGRVDGTATAYSLLLNPVGGNVGIGTSSPGTKLQINGQTRVTDGTTNIDFVSSSAVGYIGTQTNHPLVLRTNDTERMRITSAGNVGIGTSTPTFLSEDHSGLHIHATTLTSLKLTNTTSGQSEADGFELLQDDSGNVILLNRENASLLFGTNSFENMRITGAGKVGIGSGATTPPELLSVMKDNSAGRTSILINNLDQRLKMSCYYEGGVNQYAEIQALNNAETGYQNLILQRQGGEVLIGTATDNGAYKLQVNSQIYATNATIATSDSRFKTNVTSINNATSIIQLLRPVSFDFIPQTDRNFSSDRQIGLIAQEVQEVLSNTDYKDSIVAKCGDHFGLAYEKLVPLLIKALQETNQELQNIKNRLSALEGE